jgi:hypothetical protein
MVSFLQLLEEQTAEEALSKPLIKFRISRSRHHHCVIPESAPTGRGIQGKQAIIRWMKYKYTAALLFNRKIPGTNHIRRKECIICQEQRQRESTAFELEQKVCSHHLCLFVLIILLSSIQRMAVPASPTCYVVVICIGAANLEPSDKYLPVVASVDVVSREHSCHHPKSHYTISNIQVKQSIVHPKVRHFAELLIGFSNLRTPYHKCPW